jgi:hypothetical protein
LELTEALLKRFGPRYLSAGQVIVDRETESAAGLDFQEHIPSLAEAFHYASTYSAMTETDLQAIAGHAGVVWLIEPDGGSVEVARKLHHFADALLQAGGLAVKVESAGKSHTKAEWQSYDPNALMPAYVTWAGDGQRFYSCGMHNFGLPDAVLVGGDPKTAGNVLSWFNAYLLHEKPTLTSGETFSTEEGGPLWTMHHGSCQSFPDPQDLFHNPHGVWTLTPA